MGMFDRDKLMAPNGPLKEWAGVDNEFILWDITLMDGTIPTDLGEAEICHLVVSPVDAPDNKATVSMLGDIAKRRAQEKEDGDLPAVCVTAMVPSKDSGKQDAFVFRFVREYEPKAARK